MPAERLTPLHPAGVIARYVLLGAGLGVVAGLAWVVLAPRVAVRSLDPLQTVAAYPEGFAAADLTLGLLLAAAGVATGVVAARRLAGTGFERGWAQVAGVMAAGLMSAGVARVVGWWLAGRTPSPDALPLTLGATGVLLLGVLSGLLVVVVAAALAHDPPGATPAGERSGPGSAGSDPAG